MSGVIIAFVFLVGLVLLLYVLLRTTYRELEELKHRKKSYEVKTGKWAENFAPVLDGFPVDKNHTRFVGNPIDFIGWDDKWFYVIEVKTGSSQLSNNQKHIKDLVERKRVQWCEHRLS
jgi:predicted Holliday junction resolvase-like endonuclease